LSGSLVVLAWDYQGSNLDSHASNICKLRVTFIQARKILRVAFSRRQNIKMKLDINMNLTLKKPNKMLHVFASTCWFSKTLCPLMLLRSQSKLGDTYCMVCINLFTYIYLPYSGKPVALYDGSNPEPYTIWPFDTNKESPVGKKWNEKVHCHIYSKYILNKY